MTDFSISVTAYRVRIRRPAEWAEVVFMVAVHYINIGLFPGRSMGNNTRIHVPTVK